MTPEENAYVQRVFPHICYALVADCAICRWVRERWTGREAPASMRPHAPQPVRRGDEASIEFATCAQCGEIRIPNTQGKLPPHRCAA